MAFDWSDYIAFSHWLLNGGAEPNPEAAHRSAISRAYYSAFHAGMATLIRKREFTPTGEKSDHGAVIRLYLGHSSEARRIIGTWLQRLRDRRRKADYQGDAVITREVAAKAVEDAKRVITYLAAQ